MSEDQTTTRVKHINEQQYIKCVVWDLDNTLWEGVLLEDEKVEIRRDVVDIIKQLDSRGILQSIASKNEYNIAVEKLKEFGLLEYFLYPQINWNSKALSIKKIAESINIGIDTFAFVDDQPFEREEVSHSHPVVMCLDSRNLNGFLDMPEMNPRFITEDSRIRRQMYLSEIERKRIEEQIEGPKEEFLATLDMVFTISSAMQEDLKRAEELTVRTNQLNATGYTYSYEELEQFSKSTDHKLWVAGLEDKYGTYGKIGLVLVECSHQVWTLKLLLMSCRVMSRGVGSVLLNQLMSEAKKNQVGLRAEFVQTDRNRMMYVTYKFSGFKEVAKNGKVVILENDLDNIQPCPEYVSLKTDI